MIFNVSFIYYIIPCDGTTTYFEQKLRDGRYRSIRSEILQLVQVFFIKSIHLNKLDESASVIVLTSL